MKTIIQRAGIVILAAAMAGPFAAVWLSAHLVIRVKSEQGIFQLCLVAAILGIVAAFSGRKGWLNVFVACIAFVAVFVVLIFTWAASNHMFVYWKMRMISSSQWSQMAFDLDGLGRQINSDATVGEAVNRLPQSLQSLGRKEDCLGWSTYTREDGNTNIEAIVLRYGNHDRRWGFAVGPETDPYMRKFKQIPVATNAYFFCGSDW